MMRMMFIRRQMNGPPTYNVRNAADAEAANTYIDENDVYRKADVRAFQLT